MGYWLGIDAGGTQSAIVCVDKELNIKYKAKRSGIHAKRISIEKQTELIFSLIQPVLEKCSDTDIEGICIGMAGAGRIEEQQTLQSALLLRDSRFRYLVTSDALIGHVGAFHNENGILVITGTGSIVLGRKGDRWERAGGYGTLTGDEASGYHIATLGLKAISRMFDGGEGTLLMEFIQQNFGITDRDEFIHFIYSNEFEPQIIAPFVLQAADSGDFVCRKIIQTDGEQLAQQVNLIKNKLDMKSPAIILTGGLQRKKYFQNVIRECIYSNIPDVRWQTPALEPPVGACLFMMNRPGN